ncbi:ribosomal protein S18 acetylase RimI-like enzyme [Pseudomonas alcaligenes]|nr:ribosomal protein S18 acetylase RimI-like enzyme [Pseudomonas alcaligenes]
MTALRIRPIEAGEWPTYRDLRLRALRDSPEAFGSTFAAEHTRSDDAWASRIANAIASGNDRVLFALDENAACGLLWCRRSASEPTVADLYQMWVDPARRGLGAGRALLADALAWAQGLGVRRVRLGVTLAESPAMGLYRAHGFRPVGEPEPLREGSALLAQAMELELPVQAA